MRVVPNPARFITIRNVDIWNADSVRPQCDVSIKDDIVVKIEESRGAKSQDEGLLIEARSGSILLPSGVDAQVHLRIPGQPQKETAQTGLLAAAAGGVGALLTMPNTQPVIDNVEVCELGRSQTAESAENLGVGVYWSAAISKSQRGKIPVDYDALAQWGVKAFTDDGYGVFEDDVMHAAFAASARLGIPILQHAENCGHGCVLAAGPVQEKLHLHPYPESAETEMVRRDLGILKNYPGARYHVLHVSSAKTVELIKDARTAGLKASCEVTPHHLFFSSSDIDEDNTSFKMNPPLRFGSDRDYLRAALGKGDIDFVATDHAPHEPQLKSQHFKTAAFGTTGLETSLRVLLSLRLNNEITPQRLVEVFSKKPAQFLGIANEFGEIAVGKPLRACIIENSQEASLIKKDDLYSLSQNNCFLGTSLPGKVRWFFGRQRVLEFP